VIDESGISVRVGTGTVASDTLPSLLVVAVTSATIVLTVTFELGWVATALGVIATVVTPGGDVAIEVTVIVSVTAVGLATSDGIVGPRVPMTRTLGALGACRIATIVASCAASTVAS
jgi:hypothetical protein